MLNHDIPVIIVSCRLGHAKASITSDVYGHLMPNMREEAVEMIDELVTPTEVKLDGYQTVVLALHPVAHEAVDERNLQHNLNVDP
jgi:hypothetical protein